MNSQLEYIETSAKESKPFLLYLSHKALHEPFTPPQRHKTLYSEIEIQTQDNLNDNMSKKPEYIRTMAEKNRAELEAELLQSIGKFPTK